MKLFSLPGEIQALKTLGSPRIPEKVRLSFLGKMNPDLFGTDPTRAAFKRFEKYARERQEILDFEDLQNDFGLEDDFKEMLADNPEIKAVKDKKKFKRLLNDLNVYRKVRGLYFMCKDTLEELDANEKVDVDELFDDVNQKLGNLNKNSVSEEKIYHIGKGDNAVAKLEQALNAPAEKMYKTGFTDYDEANGGFPTVGLAIIAATTSGGKSVLSTNLLKNLHELNDIDTIRISLEMTIEQELKRIAAMSSGVLFAKIKKGEMTSKEKAKVLKAVKKWSTQSNKSGTRFSVTTPEGGMTVDEALAMVRPFGYKVICIDYIGLLEGMNGDKQWQALGEAARVCKIFSTKEKCLVVILAQLDDGTDKLRYSKAMKEHADVVLQWNYSDPEVRAEKILHIETSKARDGELVHFDLNEEYEYMRVSNASAGAAFSANRDDSDDSDNSDVSEEDVKKSSSRSKKRKKKKRKQKDYALD